MEELRLVQGSINHIPLAEFDAYYSFQAESYARSGIGRGSTRVLGSSIGDPQAVLLQLLEKVREFAVELQRLHIVDGMTQEQVTLLRETMQGSITWHDQSHRKFLHLQLSGMTTL